MDVCIERWRPEDASQVFRLYEQVFGPGLAASSRQRWPWQYLDNPQRDGAEPEIWVAREGEAIVGQYASMPVRLFWGGREVRASWGMDVFLRPEARRRGIGAALFTTWSDHVDVALGLGLTPSSHGLFKKLRYHDVGPVPFFQKILDPIAVARRRLGDGPGRRAGALLRLALSVLTPERPREASGIDVRSITDFSAEYDALWERWAGAYAMCVRRDAAYLRWKYARCPNRRYELREARRGGELVGLAVSGQRDAHGLRLGWLVDLFAHPSDHDAKDALLGAVLDAFRAAGVARAQAFSMNASLGRDLRRRGFVRRRSPMQLCVRARVPSDLVLRDRGRWHVVFGDSDMDR